MPALDLEFEFPYLFLFTSKQKNPVKYVGLEAIDYILAFMGKKIGITYKKVTSNSYITEYSRI